MKFSIIFEAQTVDTSRQAEFKLFHEIVDECIEAERNGFDGIWAVEHTALTQYAHMSAPETFLAYIAGRTSRLEIGHGVVCLPPAMNHPVKVAERIATLDILSRGRVHFGMGKGGTQQESGTFGYALEDLPEQILESMYMIPKIWRDGPFEHRGKYITVPPREIHPKPYQKPHPPLYLAVTRDDTLNLAGEGGLGGLVMGFGGPENVAKKNAVYRAACKRRTPATMVGEFPTEHLAALCPTIVLGNGKAARRIGTRGQRFFTESINHWYAGGPKPVADDLDLPDLEKAMSEDRVALEKLLAAYNMPVTLASTILFNLDHAYGTVDDAKAYVGKLIDAGADEILLLMQMGTVPHEAIIETIRNYGQHIIPYFKARHPSTWRRGEAT